MKRFLITVTEIYEGKYVVKAENEEEAKQKAEEFFNEDIVVADSCKMVEFDAMPSPENCQYPYINEEGDNIEICDD